MANQTMRGIDISSWQTGLNLEKLKGEVDFVIMKASEGVGLADSRFKAFRSECERIGYLWGFYHFARNNAPEADADYFIQVAGDAFGKGIPVLDLEDVKIADWGSYAQRFCDRVHAKTGIYPMVYTSAAFRNRFAKTTLPKNCALWLAGYPNKRYTTFDSVKDVELPYSIYPWESCAIWQFTGDGDVRGAGMKLDLDVAYISRDEWRRLASGGSKGKTHDENVIAAAKVIAGLYGIGKERFEALEREGFDASEVQSLVNSMLKAVM